MNTVKLPLVTVLVLVLTAPARADESDIPKKLVGKWEMPTLRGRKGGPRPPAGGILEFTKDGKVIGTPKGERVRMEGTYKVRGKALTITDKDNPPTTFNIVKVDDNELVLSYEKEEGELTLKRKKP